MSSRREDTRESKGASQVRALQAAAAWHLLPCFSKMLVHGTLESRIAGLLRGESIFSRNSKARPPSSPAVNAPPAYMLIRGRSRSTMAGDTAMADDEITSSIGEEILKASVEEINSRCR